MKRFFAAALTAAACAAGLLQLTAAPAAASPLFEPDSSWTTLETAHFRIYYTAPFKEKAKQVAAIAEDAHAHLVPYMRVKPDGPTEVIISDGYDELNSMAHASPHRAVWLWMTPPNPDEGMWIGRYDQWLRLLFIHEYTHILQFEHTPWISNQINTALGGLLLSGFPQLPIEITLNLPDLLSNAPSFFTEGLAVHTESTFTKGGRGVEGDFEMIRRMAFLEGRVPTFDQVQGRFLLDWPMAGYEYTWGTSYIQHMVKRYGEDAPVRVLEAYAGLPWLGFDTATRRVLGVSAEEIWDGMVAELKARYEAEKAAFDQRRQVAAKGKASVPRMPAVQSVTTSGRYHRHPRWGADGKLYYTESLKNQTPKLIAHDLAKDTREVVMGKSTRSAASLSADGKRVYYETDTQDTYKQLSSFRDIFVYDRETKARKRLTTRARTFAPAVSPDGLRLAAVTSGEGQSGIGIFDAEGKPLHKWTFDNNDVQFGNPAWSPDGRVLAVAVWQGGTRDIWLMSPDTGERKALFKDAAADFHPSWTPDGEHVLFTSDRTGTFNVFAYHLATGRLRQVTDMLGGAFDPVVSPDGKTLAFISYGGKGYDVNTMPFAPAHAAHVATLGAPPAKPVALPALPAVEPKALYGYNPLPTLVPSTWFPVLGQDEWGSNVTLYSFWQDVLREHAVTLVGGYGLASGRVNYGLRYENNQSVPQWAVSVFEYPNAGRVPLNNDTWGNLWQWNKTGSVIASFPGLRNPMFDPPPISGMNWNVGLRTEFVEDYALAPDDVKDATGRPAVLPLNEHPAVPTALNEGVANSVFVEWQRAEAYKRSYDYGPLEGQISSVGVEQGVPVLGASQLFTRLWGDHRFYMPLPWGDRHSLGVRTTAGAVYGRNGEFFYSIWRAPFGYTPLATINRWDLTSATSVDNRYVMLRGYPFLLGNRNATLGLEYRFPLGDVMRGWSGAPVFLNRWYGVGFVDSGFFWGLDSSQLTLPTGADFKAGAGFELRAQTTMFQAVPIDVRLGFARGLTAGGEWQPNFGLGTTF